jgi:hypothetical protein
MEFVGKSSGSLLLQVDEQLHHGFSLALAMLAVQEPVLAGILQDHHFQEPT